MESKTAPEKQNGSSLAAVTAVPASTALARPSDAAFVPATFEKAMEMASVLANATILPPDLANKEANVLIILMTGHELGLTPMQSLRGIYVVKGKPFISADLMVARCLSRRDLCEYFITVENDDVHAVCETKRV